ncbi:MAG: hypothetical protein JKY55_01025 [Aliivibrio sp.]|uniref:phage tail tube protein n=1 Tax=Aliivibrio sp. TaxID=1872443 RepID=UPI001A5B487B|nr:hypothetical protein [Aliivibrio sp.]
MPKTGIIDGGDIVVFIDIAGTPTAIAHQSECSIDHKTNFRERRTKATNGTERAPDSNVTTISVSSLATYDGYSYFDLRSKQIAKESLLIKYSLETGEETGDKYEEGDFFIESLKRADNEGDDTKVDVTFVQKAEPQVKSVTV